MLRSVDDFDSQHFAFHADGALPEAGKTVISIDDSPNGPTATIPDAHLLFNAEFKRAGSDLILNGDDGKTATVHDYFASDKHATLLSPDGAALAPDVVAALAGPLAAGQYAQATPAQSNAQAVGRVAVATGNATIVRNGVAIAVHTGDAVLKGDVLQTGSGTLGVTFNDGSTLNLTANARMVVNEFIYDPNGHANSEILSLVQGTFTAISGHVAHSGDMNVVTPVATMGIRGTVFGGTYDGTLTVYCVQSEHGVVLTDSHGNVLGQVVQDGPLLVVRPVGPLQVLAEEVQKTPQELATELSELQHIINVQTIGQQIIQQYFQQDQNNPQSNDHPHTQIDVPHGGQNSVFGDSSGGGDGSDTGGSGAAEAHVTTTIINPITTTPETIIYTVPIPANLPPVIFAPLQVTVSENQPHVFSSPDEIPSIADPDTPVLTVTLSAVHGPLSLGSISGLTFTLGDGQDDPAMTFSGSQADINTALASLTFTPDPNYLGPASITIETSDGQSTTTETISLTVENNNYAPVIAGVTSTGGFSDVTLTAIAATYLTDSHDLINGLGGSAGFGENSLGRNDDGSSAAIDITSVFGTAGLNFFGTTFHSLYINNNGNITFGHSNSAYTPLQITGGVGNPIIAPFWADVDTRGGDTAATPGGNSTGSNLVYYDLDPVNHVMTITWDDVGYYSAHTNALDAFQLQLIGLGDGNFDIVFRYEDINWTAGTASGGNSNGLGGTPARAGYSAGDGNAGHYFELGGSGDQSAMLALDNTSGNTGIAGVDIFQVLSGNVSAASVANGTIQFTDANPADTHMATEQANGANYIGTFALDDPANNNSNVTEANGSTPGSVDWHFNLTSSELNGLPIGDTVTQSYNVTIDDGQPGGQMTQTVAISWGSVAADTFTFQPGIGTDTVLNFQLGSDAIDFNNGQDSAHLGPTMTADQTNHILSLLMSNTTGDAVLNFGHGDTVTLAGISATDLQHSINHIIV
jgi:hypothetical protein